MFAWYLFPVIFCISIFQFIGHFGNFNLILLHYRLPNLRTNYGILLTILTICQSICLLFENINLFYAIYGIILGHPIYRDSCFYAMFPYVFFNPLQQGIVTMIAIDFLLCVIFPIRYRSFHQPFYLTLLLIPPAAHGLYLVIFGFLLIDKAELKLCNPPSSINPQINSINYNISLCTCSITVIAYCISFFLIYLKTRQRSRVDIESKTLKSLSVIVIVFIITRFLGIFAINIMQIMNFSTGSIIAMQNFLVIPALIGFSQNFYVCYFRSKEYRGMFDKQLWPILKYFKKTNYAHPTTRATTTISQANKLPKINS
ncbi:unnamed protein product [Caenorhabditis angaria]|uniref:G-protein coupled receptors family 1 profile domain-containing protein n=1 Tax=Caenorhabditis angaria TaxID=860376 RepID=A0A9P1IZW2_9PELO|nr:unnamed protein product [Caenorhabditis angaria]